MRSRDTSLGGSRVDFAETVWGMVERARDPSPEVRRNGLEDLTRNYWKPVYHFLRVAWAKSNDDAKDLTQAFFFWLTDVQALQRYEPERGSFRTFLKSLLRHFVQHHDEAMDRLKRGGGRTILPLDQDSESLQEVLPDVGTTTPEEAFEKEWRRSMITRAVELVRKRLASGGTSVKFQVFEKYYLEGQPERRATYESIADELKLRGNEVQHYLSDVREEVRSEIRAQIALIVSNPEDLQDEWNAFFES